MWAARERLRVWTMPHSWQDWESAKVLSLVCNNIAADEQFQSRLNETVDRALFVGTAIWNPTTWEQM
jgi:hypothetical protein